VRERTSGNARTIPSKELSGRARIIAEFVIFVLSNTLERKRAGSSASFVEVQEQAVIAGIFTERFTSGINSIGERVVTSGTADTIPIQDWVGSSSTGEITELELCFDFGQVRCGANRGTCDIPIDELIERARGVAEKFAFLSALNKRIRTDCRACRIPVKV